MRPILIGAVIFLLTLSASAGVLVNEALVNEPGTYVTLEWIELYNDSSQSVDLTLYFLDIGGTSFSLSGFLESGEYMIICRNLVENGGSPGYESVWGDSSGFWGDTPEESALKIAEESFSLLNTTGTISLYRVSTPVSQLDWVGTGADGYSWERLSRDFAIDSVIASPTTTGADVQVEIVNLGTDTAVNSADPTGSTPGRANSVSAVALKAQSILLYRVELPDSLATADTIATASIDPLAPSKRDTLTFSLSEGGVYACIGVLLSDDGRSSNNRDFVWVTGTQFPPIIISEFLPDPQDPLQTEWIELHNIGDSTINLLNWKIGDELNLRAISASAFNVAVGGRILIIQDSVAFRQFYPSFSGLLLQPSQWPSLNNAGDLVRLVDPYGFTADQYQYTSGYGGNYTWSRDESEQPNGPWAKSAESGGTPGAINQIWTQPTGDRTTVTITPQVFSPDGDGLEDESVITLTTVQASGYTLKIYDRTGRQVRTFVDNEPNLVGSYVWDGRSDAGERLPIGIYICFFEAEGVESVKETVVIAR